MCFFFSEIASLGIDRVRDEQKECSFFLLPEERSRGRESMMAICARELDKKTGDDERAGFLERIMCALSFLLSVSSPCLVRAEARVSVS